MPGADPVPAPRLAAPPRPLVELAFFLLVFVYYQAGNALWEPEVPIEALPHDASEAHENTWNLWQFERRVGLAWEHGAQAFFEPRPLLMWPLVLFYAGPHFGLSLLFMLWVYLRRPPAFAYVRNSALIFTTTAFAFNWVFPVAPPRLVSDFGMTDTIASYLPVNTQTPWINTLVNDFGSFPSVHTGWALLVALLAIRLTRTPWRWLWLGYPATIALSIVATANHITWDVVGAVAWVGGCQLLHEALWLRGVLPAPALQRSGRPGPVRRRARTAATPTTATSPSAASTKGARPVRSPPPPKDAPERGDAPASRA